MLGDFQVPPFNLCLLCGILYPAYQYILFFIRNGGMRGRGGMGDFGFRREMALAAQREQLMMEREAYGRQLVGDYGGYDGGYGANGGGYDFTADQTGAEGNGFGLW